MKKVLISTTVNIFNEIFNESIKRVTSKKFESSLTRRTIKCLNCNKQVFVSTTKTRKEMKNTFNRFRLEHISSCI